MPLGGGRFGGLRLLHLHGAAAEHADELQRVDAKNHRSDYGNHQGAHAQAAPAQHAACAARSAAIFHIAGLFSTFPPHGVSSFRIARAINGY